MRLLVRLRRFLPFRALGKVAKKIHPPGFERLSLYEVSIFFGRGLMRGDLQTRAASMAYSFFLAIFPALIFLFTLIPYVPIKHFDAVLFESIRGLMPASAFATIESTVVEILQHENFRLLSFGFIFAIFFSTNGIVSMITAFNKSIHVKERRPEWKTRLIAVIFVFFTMVCLVISIALLIGSERMLDTVIKGDKLQVFLIAVGRWIILGALFMLLIGATYRFGPAKKMHRHYFSPGVILATLLILLTSWAFAWFINNFGNYNTLYGSIGSIIVVLIWLFYISMMLIVGFELDAGIQGAHENRRTLLEQEDIEIEKQKREG